MGRRWNDGTRPTLDGESLLHVIVANRELTFSRAPVIDLTGDDNDGGLTVADQAKDLLEAVEKVA